MTVSFPVDIAVNEKEEIYVHPSQPFVNLINLCPIYHKC